MGDVTRLRMLAIMGSGETSPTMVTIHKALASRLSVGQHGASSNPRAILLDTPYAFQENVADISARAQAYFARSVGLDVAVVSDANRAATPGDSGPSGSGPSGDRVPGDRVLDDAVPSQATTAATAGLAAIRSSDWVFVGPGSPSYALSRWRDGPVEGALRERIAAGAGITIIASAAAAAMGLLAVPVYEIYKVGADPHWLAGLDLLSVLGLKVAVIPHYDNAEGGTHDTRFCYLGERRLAVMERELPPDAAVLGVDEHTTLVLDLQTDHVEVTGRGGVTVRKAGRSTVLPAGSELTLPELRAMVISGTTLPQASRDQPGRPEAAGDGVANAATTRASPPPAKDLPDVTRDAEGSFDAASGERDAGAMVSAILDLEAAIEAWSTDTDENDNADQARAVLRGLVVRLGRAAEQGLSDPADRLRPAVEPLLTLRDTLRKDGSYAAADAIRDAVAAAGISVRDSPDGTTWAVDAS
jgi:hypothetical protein